MKVCPNCKSNIDDNVVFCTACGANVASPQVEPQPNVTYAPPVQPQSAQPSVEYAQPVQPQAAQFVSPQNGQPYNGQPNNGQQVPPQGEPYYTAPPVSQPAVDQYDHTSEFDAKDIADNKLYAMLVYLLSVVGIVIALLVKKDSPFLEFHIKQGLKLVIVETIVSLATALLCWTCIVPVAGSVILIALTVVQIICILDVCNGKAKDAPIIRSIKFLDSL